MIKEDTILFSMGFKKPTQKHHILMLKNFLKILTCTLVPYLEIVGSVVNFLSYRYRADKSTIFGIRGL